MDMQGDENNAAPPCPDPLRGVWGRTAPPFEDYGVYKQMFVVRSIHNPAYLSISVTSSSGTGLCGAPGRGVFRGSGVRLCTILDMNFRELLFYEVG
jgi:hypothetical protein